MAPMGKIKQFFKRFYGMVFRDGESNGVI